MIATSSCHDAPIRKLNNGETFCQTCGQPCTIVEQLELTDKVEEI